jgi:L-histidine Nalpha-methyltransferase
MLTQTFLTDTTCIFAEEIRAGLTRSGQKTLPSKYLYDDVGSALFEVISVLPQYGLTRADERLLRRHAADVVEMLPSPVEVVELGSGCGKKTRWILEALSRRQAAFYYPIDISPVALDRCRRELGDVSSIRIETFEQTYLDGLLEVSARRQPGHHLLVLFLGSTLGNFERPARSAFLRQIHLILQQGDALLLGTDLEKPIPQLLAAYDDPLGVTAAFNLNLLARMNRELAADFDLAGFRHCAIFNQETRSVEMHLRSMRTQTVTVNDLGFSVTFAEKETIWTESSHKFSVEEVSHLAGASGFRCESQWIDREWPFAETLLIAE